jgi:two-component system chemotaxis sensor kinase CheA
MTIDMSQFFLVFFDESDELLAEKERLLLELDLDAPDPESIAAIFRVAHSIKGGAATFGLADMTEVTHILESLLDRIRKGEMPLTAEHLDVFFAAKDILKMQLDGHRNGSPVDDEAVLQICARLRAMSHVGTADVHANVHAAAPGTLAAAGPGASPVSAASAASTGRQFRIALPAVPERDVVGLEAELGLLGSITRSRDPAGHAVLLLSTNETIDDILAICSFVVDPDDLKISEVETEAPATSSQSDDAFGLFGTAACDAPDVAVDCPAATLSATSPAPSAASAKPAMDKAVIQESTSIRVSIEKVDQLINLVGELVITQAMIEQRTDALDPMLHERLLNSVSQLTRNTRDLQEAVMSIRMMPMDYVFSRFPRMVRDLAGKLGKKVEFITHGAATELDKGLIERIIDPLTHLVRNSVDHGIEMPEKRRADGKPEAGRLSLAASHQGGNIVIEVSDDGGGLNRARILEKAQQQGLAVSDNMPDEDVWQLIFAPGFSTAETVTDVSGRGVGMDVVKRNITSMGGVVDIRSVPNVGTTISISLPLTLAILDGMSIKVGDEVYILPLGYVVESLQPKPSDVKDIAGQEQVVKVRGEYLPLIPLHQMFDITPRYRNPSDGIVVILEAEGNQAALLVDELVGQQQVVVKNLESNYRKVAGISGATILGDGGVSLILDVAALLRSSRQLRAKAAHS